MRKTIACLKVFGDRTSVDDQRAEIIDYAGRKAISIDEFVELDASKGKHLAKKLLQEISIELGKNGTFVVTDLCNMGLTAPEIFRQFYQLINKNVRVVITRHNLHVSREDFNSRVIQIVFRLLSELDSELAGQRIKDVLAQRKADGARLGKPFGTIQRSKFDDNIDQIREMLSMGVSVRKIAGILGYNNHIGLNNYINRRRIKAGLEKKYMRQLI